MSLCWMYWINADSQWQGVSIKLSTSAGFCDIFSPRLAMELPIVGLHRSCSLDGALSLELVLGTKAAMSRGMMCGTRWRSWPTSTDPRCFTTWQIWWRRTPKQNCGLYSIKVIKKLSSSFDYTTCLSIQYICQCQWLSMDSNDLSLRPSKQYLSGLRTIIMLSVPGPDVCNSGHCGHWLLPDNVIYLGCCHTSLSISARCLHTSMRWTLPRRCSLRQVKLWPWTAKQGSTAPAPL